MMVKKYETERSFKQAIEYYKNQGYTFLGLTWYSAIFKELVLIRNY